MVDGNKQVRVDNWGTFFLQRLQVFFAKTDYCDLTLQFEGNVQLKVHRLVMNACTEYFKFLEETCPAVEESTIVMPHDLQSDVIVPIVNFMYTGMLEFHISLFDKLYKAAELMNISILTILLDAQKIHKPKVKQEPPKKPAPPRQTPFFAELPPPLPGRKTPVWKRKTAPAVSTPPNHSPHTSSHSSSFDTPRWHTPDPLVDNTPKPTRFEWPEDDLPTMTMMETSFEDISYTSRPLLTKEEEEKVQPNFDDLRNNVELPKKLGSKGNSSTAINFKEIEEFSKEQKIRTAMFEDLDEINEASHKRKADTAAPLKSATKKIKISNKENKETTISVESSTPGDIDHTKIVTEILKKYPELVKKNKNIKLKIMPGNKDSGDKKIVNAVVEPIKRLPQAETVSKSKTQVLKQVIRRKLKPESQNDEDGPWVCKKCISAGGNRHEFVLYYLYRKHMTDVHDEVFDARLCKYCGRKCNNHNLMLYHMYTKHALKPPASYVFPKCDRCPYIALSKKKLQKHRLLHDVNEMQCQDCKLAFTSPQTLTAHIRITSHYNKPGRVSYDCQYCMKKLQSAINLFTHIKKSHLPEGKRDGIVGLDELDAMDDLDEEDEAPDEEEEGEEYILPEILSDTSLQKDKVKIISNVKVPPNRQVPDSTEQNQMVSLEPSSEADALNNVTGGIATSLNLVDIVVLDENQQYILQQDGQNEQEFIIPDLTHGQPFAGQVITTQDSSVIQQGMIQNSSGDIASTDELVMVLTDHDYPDEHEGENPENSNIVVLYSHPVEGQGGQFITSQGNLMVNSQTGMFEIRNGSTIATTSASQMVVTNSVDAPIESIEMIQREIQNHRTSELKEEPLFEDERKHELKADAPTGELQSMPDIQELAAAAPDQVFVEHQAELCNPTEEQPIVETDENAEVAESQAEQLEESLDVSSEQQPEEKDTSEDNADGSLDVSAEEPMEIDEMQHTTAETEEVASQEQVEEHHIPYKEVVPSELSTEHDGVTAEEPRRENVEDGADIPPDVAKDIPYEEVIMNDSTFITAGTATKEPPLAEHEILGEQKTPGGQEPMEVDGKVVEEEDRAQEEEIEHTAQAEEIEDTIQAEEIEDTAQAEEIEETAQAEEIEDAAQEEEKMGEKEIGSNEQEGEASQPVDDIGKTISQEELNDENIAEDPLPTAQVEEEEENEKNEEDPLLNEATTQQTPNSSKADSTDINKTILDDWEEEDTDSQQSEKNADSEPQVMTSSQNSKNSQVNAAAENVNKLMDDWDEVEEEDKTE